MKVSIITVVYNNPMVAEALDSVLSQQLDAEDELELVVIDGGSTDGTMAVLEGYRSRLGVLVSEPDGGIYDAMNKGIALATGDVVGILNADDLYQDERAIATVLAAFRANPVQIVYGDLVYVQRDNPARVVRYWKSCSYTMGLFQTGWMPPHPTFFVQRDVYKQHGLFDLAYRLGADFDLTMRFLAIANLPSCYIPSILVRMRLGGATNNSLNNILKANIECYRACQKNGLAVSNWFIFRKLISRIPQFFNHPSV